MFLMKKRCVEHLGSQLPNIALGPNQKLLKVCKAHVAHVFKLIYSISMHTFAYQFERSVIDDYQRIPLYRK